MKEFDNLIEANNKTMTKNKAKEYNSLVFAFVGDGVHTLFVRTHLASGSTAQAGKLHSLTNNFVKASAQAKVLDQLTSSLTEEELQIGKTARNAKSKSVAKNAGLQDYKKATSFEAIIGYLYLTNQTKRMIELLEKSLRIMEQQ